MRKLSLKFKDVVGNIFHTEEKAKAEEEQKSSALQQKVGSVFGTGQTDNSNTFNPFVNKNGELVNPYMDYQTILDNPSISQKAKDYITQATGLSPTETVNSAETDSGVSPTTYANTSGRIKSNSNIVNAAQNYIGTPYVWGGESTAEGGMDCSGFVYNALKDAGYNIGRTTAQGYRSYGSTVSKANMQPGDLVFFGKNNNATHIGIYIGNGQMIHSSGGSNNTKSNPGKGVSITNVDYRSDFLEARRY